MHAYQSSVGLAVSSLFVSSVFCFCHLHTSNYVSIISTTVHDDFLAFEMDFIHLSTFILVSLFMSGLFCIILYSDLRSVSQPAADALLEHKPPHPGVSEGDGQTDVEELSHTIQDLESQVDTLRRAESLALEKVVTLEDELKNMKTLEEVCALVFTFAPGLCVCLSICGRN